MAGGPPTERPTDLTDRATMGDDQADARRALPLTEAAELTGLSTEALRSRWRRKTLDGYRDNAGHLFVFVDRDRLADHPGGRPGRRPAERSTELADLRAQLAAVQADRDRLADQVAGLRGERDRLADQAADLRSLQAIERELRRELGEVKAERDRLLAAMLDRWPLWTEVRLWLVRRLRGGAG